MPTFFQGWSAGIMTREVMKTALGGALAGVLAQFAIARENGFVGIPGALSFEEAATLPCAALTAWHALVENTGSPLRAGQSIFTLGTGAVLLFAVLFATV